jgi:NADPH-dependent curcumin reductase
VPALTPPPYELPGRYQRVVFAARPTGLPGPECYRLEQAELLPPGRGEVLVRNEYLSVDPYIRMRMEAKDSYAPVMALGDVMVGRTVGQIVASQAEGWAPGEWVVGRLGWQTYSLAKPADLQRVDVQAAPASAWLGALGSTGVTAWIGLTLFGQPQGGQTVLVSAASGAVGSVVGQLARLAGCRAVGIAGGDEKCRLVREAYGFDDCVDYKAKDFADRLAAALPSGADIYFDNVGGEILDTVLPLMNLFGRIPVCGLVSQYNATEPYGVKHLREIFNRRLTMRGFVISDHREHFAEATAALLDAYRAGRLHWRESIAEGLERAPEAFLAVLQGRKVGKQLVKLQPGKAGG